jgi:hypothetical protein
MKNLKQGLTDGTALRLSALGHITTAVTEWFIGQINFHADTGSRDLEGYPIIEVNEGGSKNRVSAKFVCTHDSLPICDEIIFT